MTGVNHGSITSDIVSVYFNHVDGRVDSEDTFMFAVSQLYLTFYNNSFSQN